MREHRTTRDVIVMGGTGVLNTWLFDLVSAACERSVPPIEVRFAGRGQMVEAIGHPDGPRRALLVREPARDVMEAIASQAVPVVAVVDDPVDMVRMSRAHADGSLMDALREQTCSASAYHLLRDNTAAMTIRRGQAGAARDVATAVLRHLDIGLDAALETFVLDAFAGAPDESLTLEEALRRRVPGYAPLNELSQSVTAEEASIVRRVLSPIFVGAFSPDVGRITWPPQVFLSGEAAETFAPGVVDIAGGARILFYGPYFHLPPGQWQVSFVVAFSDEAKRMPFRLILQSNLRPIAWVNFRAAGHGAFEGSFTFRHVAPEHSVEINLMSEEGSIEGHLALGKMSFDRLGP